MTKFQAARMIFRKAIQGGNHDYTKGSIVEAVVLLAIPMILELGLESVFAVVDMYFVSGLGPAAIATVGLTESVITLVYSVSIGVSAGATAIVARRIGEKNVEGASHVGAQSILIGLILGVVLGGIGVFFAADILEAMGADAEVVSQGTPFARIMFGGSTSIVLLFLINGIFRGAGDAAMAMRSLWFASGINILLCPIFIHLFDLKGAALATLVGRSAGVLYQCYHLFRGDQVIALRKHHFAFDISVIKGIFNLAWPASLQFLIGSGSWILLMRLVAETGGTDASAGYQIAFRNFVFFILPAWGLSNAAATLVGQNLGAQQVERAERSVITTAKISIALMSVVTFFLIVLARPIVGVFTSDPNVLSYGVEGLRIISSGFIFFGISMVLNASLNGAGDTQTPTRINLVCFWLFQTPLAYFLVQTELKTAGVMITVPLAHVLMTIIAWYYFKLGRWRKIKV